MKQAQFAKDRKDIRELQNKSKQPEIASRKVVMRENKNQPIIQFSRTKQLSLTLKEQKESLPIFRLRTELMKAVRGNQVMVVIGETGSGKTT